MASIALSPVGKVLIVGPKPNHFRKWLVGRSEIEKRIEFWYSTSTNGKMSERESIPRLVEAIILTKFISHSEYEKVVTLAKKSGIHFQRIVRNIGEIKRVLEVTFMAPTPIQKTDTGTWQPTTTLSATNSFEEHATVQAEKEKAEPEERKEAEETREEKTKTTSHTKRGVLRDFILENVNFSVQPGSEEIKRLWQLVANKGLAKSEASLAQTFYELRKLDKSTRPDSASEMAGAALPLETKAETGARDSAEKALDQFINSAATLSGIMQKVLSDNDKMKKEVGELRSQNKRLVAENKNLKGELKKELRIFLKNL